MPAKKTTQTKSKSTKKVAAKKPAAKKVVAKKSAVKKVTAKKTPAKKSVVKKKPKLKVVATTNKSKIAHSYSLDEYGLTEKKVRDQFSDYMLNYDF